MKRLRDLLHAEGISQAELAAGIDKSESFVSLILSGDSHPSQQTIDDTLSFLCLRLGRKVTYEEIHETPEGCE